MGLTELLFHLCFVSWSFILVVYSSRVGNRDDLLACLIFESLELVPFLLASCSWEKDGVKKADRTSKKS